MNPVQIVISTVAPSVAKKDLLSARMDRVFTTITEHNGRSLICLVPLEDPVNQELEALSMFKFLSRTFAFCCPRFAGCTEWTHGAVVVDGTTFYRVVAPAFVPKPE
jgi:hypothetical protein